MRGRGALASVSRGCSSPRHHQTTLLARCPSLHPTALRVQSNVINRQGLPCDGLTVALKSLPRHCAIPRAKRTPDPDLRDFRAPAHLNQVHAAEHSSGLADVTQHHASAPAGAGPSSGRGRGSSADGGAQPSRSPSPGGDDGDDDYAQPAHGGGGPHPEKKFFSPRVTKPQRYKDHESDEDDDYDPEAAEKQHKALVKAILKEKAFNLKVCTL